MSTNSRTNTDTPTKTSAELQQDLDEDLSQLVHEYQSKGLDADTIVDSVLWHAEVARTRSND